MKTSIFNTLKQYSTQINNNANKLLNVTGKIVLNDFVIGKKIENVVSGEAQIYHCSSQSQSDKKFILKLYTRKDSVKPEIIEALKNINNVNICPIVASGQIEEKTFVIMPYYENGSLRNLVTMVQNGQKIELDEFKSIIKPLVYAINELHNCNIIHKDIKPDNIMIDGDNLVLIDFGISSSTNNQTVILTDTGLSLPYAAPEAKNGIHLRESDYYSLGITLYELFCGHKPFENLSMEEAHKMVLIQQIPFDEDFPQELKQLIIGLTYIDVTNRNDLNNPNRRWGFKEVCNWLEGKEQPIPGNATEKTALINIVPITFNNQRYTDSYKLIEAMLSNWDEGIKFLGRESLTDFYRNNNCSEKVAICEEACNKLVKENADVDSIFAKCMYKLEPSLLNLYWKKQKYENIYEYGKNLIREANLTYQKEKIQIKRVI